MLSLRSCLVSSMMSRWFLDSFLVNEVKSPGENILSCREVDALLTLIPMLLLALLCLAFSLLLFEGERLMFKYVFAQKLFWPLLPSAVVLLPAVRKGEYLSLCFFSIERNDKTFC